MSGRIVGLVLAHKFEPAPRRPDVDPAARYGCSAIVLKMVMVAMANRCDDHGRKSHPGIREIAGAAQITKDTAVIALAHLRIDGYLFRTGLSDRHLADTYRLDLERLETVHRRAGDPRAETPGDPRTTSYVPRPSRLTPPISHRPATHARTAESPPATGPDGVAMNASR